MGYDYNGVWLQRIKRKIQQSSVLVYSGFRMHIWHPWCWERSPGHSQTINKSIPVIGMYIYVHNHVWEKEMPQQRTQLQRCWERSLGHSQTINKSNPVIGTHTHMLGEKKCISREHSIKDVWYKSDEFCQSHGKFTFCKVLLTKYFIWTKESGNNNVYNVSSPSLPVSLIQQITSQNQSLILTRK
jgi:hypothetical protein